MMNEKEANPKLCKVTNEKEADPHLWGGLLWPVGLPHHGFPRDCVLQQRTQPLALPGFGKFHLYLSWSSPPPQQIQLPAGTERTHTPSIQHRDTPYIKNNVYSKGFRVMPALGALCWSLCGYLLKYTLNIIFFY